MRDNLATLQNAIQVTSQEQTSRRFDLRSGSQYQAAEYANEEPVNISHARVNLRCYRYNRQGHKAKDCRAH